MQWSSLHAWQNTSNSPGIKRMTSNKEKRLQVHKADPSSQQRPLHPLHVIIPCRWWRQQDTWKDEGETAWSRCMLGRSGCLGFLGAISFFWACSSLVDQDYHSSASAGVRWRWESPSFPGLQREVKYLLEKCALQVCWTGDAQLFWHQVWPGFQSFLFSLLSIPQRVILWYKANTSTGKASSAGRRAGPGECRMGTMKVEIQFAFTTLNMDLSHFGYQQLRPADPHYGCSPWAVWEPPCD